MTLFLLIGLSLMLVSAFLVLSACMLSSQVSRRERGEPVQNRVVSSPQGLRPHDIPAAVYERRAIPIPQREQTP